MYLCVFIDYNRCREVDISTYLRLLRDNIQTFVIRRPTIAQNAKAKSMFTIKLVELRL